jgi:alanine-synthesizing transaminase
MNTDFHKIRRLPPYVFEQVNRTKAALRADGADIIDLGMGNPDLPTPKHIVDKLCETARRPDVNGYSASRGIPGLRRALTDYYKRRFDVKLDKDREVIVTLGSKEGFANLAQAISAPGDVILAPDPSYPLHHFGFIIAGASIRGVPAQTPEQYLSNLGKAVHYSDPAADSHGSLLSVQPDGRSVRSRFL